MVYSLLTRLLVRGIVVAVVETISNSGLLACDDVLLETKKKNQQLKSCY